MAEWEYNPDDYNPDGYGLIPPGEYRVRIEKCEEKVSQTGKDMFKLTLAVSGYSAHVWCNLVFDSTDEESRRRTNNRLGSVYDSFNIPKGNLNPDDWKGKVGGAKIRHKIYNEETRAELHYFLTRKKVDALPAWQEGSRAKSPVHASDADNFSPEPFNPEEGFGQDKIPF